jgi:hypothetical protein
MNNMKDVMLEQNPEDGVWWTYLEDGRTKQVLGSEVSFRQCKLT